MSAKMLERININKIHMAEKGPRNNKRKSGLCKMKNIRSDLFQNCSEFVKFFIKQRSELHK